MRFLFNPMHRGEAREILGWRYEGPYSFYNGPDDVNDEDLKEMLDGSHVSVMNGEGETIGFFGFGTVATVPEGESAGVYDDPALDIGLGLRPDLTGKGLGHSFLAAGLDYALRTYEPLSLRLTVATFNRRAIVLYERAGFKGTRTFTSASNGGAEFLVMVRDVHLPEL